MGGAGWRLGFGEGIWGHAPFHAVRAVPCEGHALPWLLGPWGLRISSGFYLPVILKSALLLRDRGWCLE